MRPRLPSLPAAGGQPRVCRALPCPGALQLGAGQRAGPGAACARHRALPPRMQPGAHAAAAAAAGAACAHPLCAAAGLCRHARVYRPPCPAPWPATGAHRLEWRPGLPAQLLRAQRDFQAGVGRRMDPPDSRQGAAGRHMGTPRSDRAAPCQLPWHPAPPRPLQVGRRPWAPHAGALRPVPRGRYQGAVFGEQVPGPRRPHRRGGPGGRPGPQRLPHGAPPRPRLAARPRPAPRAGRGAAAPQEGVCQGGRCLQLCGRWTAVACSAAAPSR